MHKHNHQHASTTRRNLHHKPCDIKKYQPLTWICQDQKKSGVYVVSILVKSRMLEGIQEFVQMCKGVPKWLLVPHKKLGKDFMSNMRIEISYLRVL